MIKDIRVVEWDEGKVLSEFHWDIQIMREGSRKWESIQFVKLKRKPKHVSRENKK